MLYRDEAYALISITAPPYEESKHPYRYTKLSESCKQVKIINQNHIFWQKQVDKITLQSTLYTISAHISNGQHHVCQYPGAYNTYTC